MTGKITRFLPKFYATEEKDSALRHLTDALAARLEETEKAMVRIALSRYIDFASTDVLGWGPTEDLDRIGALYNIKRAIERTRPEDHANEGDLTEAHRKMLERYRKRLADTIGIFLGGLSTAKAIIKTVGAVFGFDVLEIVLPNNEKTVDYGGRRFIVKSDAYTTTALLVRPDREEAPFTLTLVDNPWREVVRTVLEMEAALPFTIRHGGLSGTDPKITVSPPLDPEKQPGIFGQSQFGGTHFFYSLQLDYPVLANRSTGQLILFNGVIPSGEKLTIERSGRRFSARLNGEDQSGKLFFVSGSRFGTGTLGESRLGSIIRNPPLAGTESGRFGTATFGDSAFRFDEPAELLAPLLAPGESQWELLSLEGPLPDGGRPKVFFSLLRGRRQELPGELRFQWREQARGTFAVRLPRSIGFLVSESQRKLFMETVSLVKAAGTEAVFDFQNIFVERHDDVRDTLASTDIQKTTEQETHELSVGFSIDGLFGRTRFNGSVLG